MNGCRLVILLLITLLFVQAISGGDLLQFEGKIGFTKAEDSIVAYRFLNGGSRLLIIGEKNIQVWDIPNAKLLNSVSHQISQFSGRNFVEKYVLMGIPEILSWRPYLIDTNGKWIITAEKRDDKELRSAVVRDLTTMKEIAILDLPNVSTSEVALDDKRNEIVTSGETDKTAAFTSWDKDTFKAKEIISIDDYKWHHLIKNDQKMLVGTGDTKILWISGYIKHGDTLTLRDVKTGAIEKEFTAKNLTPKTSFHETEVSQDEKFLISIRDNRIFVWDINGDGVPRFEISRKSPKENFQFVKIIGGRFIVTSEAKKLTVYDCAGNGTPKYILAADKPNDCVNLIDVTKDNRLIVVGDDQKLSILETAGDGKPLYEIHRRSEKERFYEVGFMTGENYLVVDRSEKKTYKTEFYDIKSGKLVIEAPVGRYDSNFLSNKRYLYTEGLGVTTVWDFAEKRLLQIPLKVYYPSDDSTQPGPVGEPNNLEHTSLSPNEKFILRFGGDVVSIFDIETSKEAQIIFDAGKVKYDKQNKIKYSGLANAGWTEDGRYVYALERTGLFGQQRTVSFWRVTR